MLLFSGMEFNKNNDYKWIVTMATTGKSKIFNINNLNDWAGEKIVERGRRYQRDGNVRELVFLKDGRLGALVRGTRSYRTAVSFDEKGRIESDCTCPYGSNCKHAVAAVFEYCHRLESGQGVQTSKDSKYDVLNWDAPEHGPEIKTLDTGAALEAWVRGQSADQLIVLLLGICRDNPNIAAELTNMINLEKGNADALMREIRQQTRALIECPDLDDDDGEPPVYSDLLRLMRQVLPLGVADELLGIMDSLIEAVQEHIGIYDNEGEFAESAAQCYTTAVEILRASTLDYTKKLLWAIEQILADQYGLCDSLEEYLAEKHPPGSWSEVADELLIRLKKQKAISGKRSWERDQFSNWIVRALEESGRADEIIALCEQEVKLTKSYVRLVRRLIEAGRLGDAERYIAKGVADTYKDLPGIASALRKLRVQICSEQKNWAAVLAYQVCEFVESPSLGDYGEVKKVAAKMKSWPMVQASLLEYLKAGIVPWKQAGWNLPEPDQVDLARNDRWKKSFPQIETIIEIAILDKDLDEVVKWHERLWKNERYGSSRFRRRAFI